MNTRIVQDLRLDADDAISAFIEISKRCKVEFVDFDVTLYFRSEPSILTIFQSWLRRTAPLKQVLTIEQLIGFMRRRES